LTIHHVKYLEAKWSQSKVKFKPKQLQKPAKSSVNKYWYLLLVERIQLWKCHWDPARFSQPVATVTEESWFISAQKHKDTQVENKWKGGGIITKQKSRLMTVMLVHTQKQYMNLSRVDWLADISHLLDSILGIIVRNKTWV